MGNCVGGKGKKDPTILTEEEIKILLDNTQLSRAQINALHQNFLKECPSGKLTKKDFVKLFKEVHPSESKKEKADKFCEYVFKVIDHDSLGYISFNDFVLCFSLTSYGDFKQKCEFAFRLYDLDRDGRISKKEMTQVLTALYDLSGITDRKKNNAPAKKVDDIMAHINAQSEAKEKAAAEAAAAAEPAAEAKAPAAKPKAAKKEKPKNFITKDQFIEACSEDEALKKLFVDSIFAATAAEPVFEASGEQVNAAVIIGSEPAVNGEAFEVTTTSKVECVEFRSLDAPEQEPAAVAAAEEAPEAPEEPAAAAQDAADALFDQMDTNNDGQIDAAEFRAALVEGLAEVVEVKSDESAAVEEQAEPLVAVCPMRSQEAQPEPVPEEENHDVAAVLNAEAAFDAVVEEFKEEAEPVVEQKHEEEAQREEVAAGDSNLNAAEPAAAEPVAEEVASAEPVAEEVATAEPVAEEVAEEVAASEQIAEEVAAVIQALDTNNDGKIDEEEFRAGVAAGFAEVEDDKNAQTSKSEEIAQAFDALDANNDGQIDAGELRAAVEAGQAEIVEEGVAAGGEEASKVVEQINQVIESINAEEKKE